MMDLIKAIKESFGTSTASDNGFSNLVNSIVWDSIMTDDETNVKMYFSGKMVLVAESLNPFAGARPYIMHLDGSMINL